MSKKKTLYAWCLKCTDKIEDILVWAEGHGGIEYAVLDSV
jgi:hypothetical protein